MKTLTYMGTPNFNEYPVTGRVVTWTYGQTQSVDDGIADLLLAANSYFTQEATNPAVSPLTDEQAANPLIKGVAGADNNGGIYDAAGNKISISGGTYPKYLGAVAGTRTPTFEISNSNSIQSRFYMRFSDSVPFQIGFVNWFGSMDANGSGTVTFKASWEYPIGTTPVQLMISGKSSVSLAPGQESGLWDTVENPPAPGRHGILTVYAISTGVNIITHTGINAAIGEQVRYGNNLTDQTLTGSGTPLSGGSDGASLNVSLGPALIVGATTKPTIFEIGDSRRSGQDNAAGYSHGRGQAQRQYEDAGIGYISTAIAGTQAQNYLSQRTKSINLSQYCTHVDTNFGVNDLNSGRSASQLISDLRAIRNSAKLSSKVFGISTLTPHVTTTDNLLTTANQTVFSGSAQRLSFNNQVRAGLKDFQYLSDYAILVEHPYDPGKWQVGPTADATGAETPTKAVANYYCIDGVHENERANMMFLRNKVSFCYSLRT